MRLPPYLLFNESSFPALFGVGNFSKIKIKKVNNNHPVISRRL